jgi:hypothetical protein
MVEDAEVLTRNAWQAIVSALRTEKPHLGSVCPTGIPVVPIKELIRMKDKSNRPQDQADIFYLKKIIGEWRDEN